MTELRILFVSSGLDRGGAESFLARLSSRLSARGHAVLVASLGTKTPLASELANRGVGVAALGRGVAAAGRLVSVARRFGPTIVQGWMYRGNLAGWTAAAAAERPALIWSVRQGLDDYAVSPVGTRCAIRASALLSRRPRAIVYNAVASARQHEAFGFAPDRTRVIPNGIEVAVAEPTQARRAALRASLGLAPGDLAVGLFARWHPVKNHEGFARAAGALVRRRPEARFVLAGAGISPANARLAAWLRGSGALERCLLLGERVDAAELASALDVATIASHGEAFPNTLLEAMAAGVPCVAPDVGDVADLIGDTGVVVARDDPAALAAGWDLLAALPAEGRRALGDRARRRVIARFGLDAVADAFEALYTEP
ncbi:MAG TPA: glycosyltransferase [Candidatus Sulfotelmatobacter sp.]|nr:glycosyltransferase [Candidatus Sulfotelmatobacter sp.]